jgi:hypothetical protein
MLSLRHRRNWLLLAMIAVAPGRAEAQTGSPGLQLHGNAFAAFVSQNTFRGGSSFQSTGWLMATFTGGNADGELGARAMVTIDPITLGDCGYPRLLIGRTALCEGRVFEDRLGAHPLLMDLSAHAARRISSALLSLRVGLVGEPVLGPTSYMHRASAANDPMLPLTSFDLNPAHLSNGFATLGGSVGRWTMEMSFFNSAGGDANLYDIDSGPFQSWAGRLQLRVGRASRWQISAGELESSSEGAHAGHGAAAGDVRALTTSFEAEFDFKGASVNSTLAWGRQKQADLSTDAVLAEALLRYRSHALSVRAETSERVAQQQIIGPLQPDGTHEHTIVNHVIRDGEVAAAYSLHLIDAFGLQMRGGVRAGLTFIPEFRELDYGQRRGRAFAAFLNVQPGGKQAAAHVH